MFNFIFYSKKNLFLIIGLLAVIFVLFIISIFSTHETKPTQNPSVNSSIIPHSSIFKPQANNLPPSQVIPSASLLPAYKPEELEKDYQRIIARKPISSDEQAVRQNIISSLNNQSGILEKTPDYKIEYVRAPNVFMVEITSMSPDIAKAAATNWFRDQGLTSEGVCNLPVVFYLSSEINDLFSQSGLQFNPIPEGCEQ